MKRKIRGIVLILLGLALSFTATGILATYERRSELAGDNAEFLLEELHREMAEKPLSYDAPAVQEEAAEGEMPQTTLSGYALVGMLQIPTLGMELPVLDSWSYDLLQIAPCRYSGTVEDGNLILLGHNYKRHLGSLKKVSVGDEVRFVTVDGKTHTYTVSATEILEKTELERLSATEHDLTVFTCTYSGYSRFVVRCDLIPNPNEV